MDTKFTGEMKRAFACRCLSGKTGVKNMESDAVYFASTLSAAAQQGVGPGGLAYCPSGLVRLLSQMLGLILAGQGGWHGGGTGITPITEDDFAEVFEYVRLGVHYADADPELRAFINQINAQVKRAKPT